MIQRFTIPQNLRPIIIVLLPLSLWMMLILSLQPGNIGGLANPSLNFTLLQNLRAIFPLTAMVLAVALMAFNFRRQQLRKALFLGPLGLAAVYGLVGVLASTLSPDGSQSLYWSASYVAVPLVLWAIVWGPDSLERASHVVDLNWLVIMIGAAILLIFALVKLDFGSFLVSPSSWLDCDPEPWYRKTSHVIRQTGVGRYAAITGLLALGRLWHPRWRTFWVLVLLASIFLLLSTGARTSIVGFIVATPVVVLLSGGKKAAVVSVTVLAIMAPVVWATGIHETFLNNCVFRSSRVIDADDQTPRIQSTQFASDTSPIDIRPRTSLGPGIVTASDTSPGLRPRTSLGPDIVTAQKSNVSAPAVSTAVSTPISPTGTNIPGFANIPPGFFEFTGRTKVWKEGLELFRESPLLGYGFQADRLILGAHAHNSMVHSLLQTGLIGTIPFFAGIFLGWALLIRTLRRLNGLASVHKTLVIQIAGILTFLSVRSFTESTGAFFGVDWLILGPLLLYIALIHSAAGRETPSQ